MLSDAAGILNLPFDRFVSPHFGFKEADAGDAIVAGIDESLGVETCDRLQNRCEFAFDSPEEFVVEFFNIGLIDSH